MEIKKSDKITEVLQTLKSLAKKVAFDPDNPKNPIQGERREFHSVLPPHKK